MTLTVIREDVSMIKKQLIQTIPESKKYTVGIYLPESMGKQDLSGSPASVLQSGKLLYDN